MCAEQKFRRRSNNGIVHCTGEAGGRGSVEKGQAQLVGFPVRVEVRLDDTLAVFDSEVLKHLGIVVIYSFFINLTYQLL